MNYIDNKNKIYKVIFSIIGFILTLSGVSYAYFATRINNNENASTIIGEAANLILEFKEGEQITGNDIFPGWSSTKTFTVNNKNNVNLSYDLYIIDIENNLMEGSISYKIESTNGGYNKDKVLLPSEDEIIAKKINIKANTIHNYKITVYYNNLDVNQESDKGKTFLFKIYIKESMSSKLIVDLNNGTSKQNFNKYYKAKEIIELEEPIRDGYTFAGWEVITGDGIIDGNKLTMGNNNVSIKALWQETWNFDFTGSEQTFTVPYDGLYKLETWGAQGGNGWYKYSYTNAEGGVGGYSYGTYFAKKGTKLYINVGEQGQKSKMLSSSTEASPTPYKSYNGGGRNNSVYSNPYYYANGGGGGATHIATMSGLLATLEDNKSSILIVAGGGGGANLSWDNNISENGGYCEYNGGSGGGYKGNSGISWSESYEYGLGGQQQSILSGTYKGTFGQGADGGTTGAGGGGGYYGGNGSKSWGSAGGGSGYIGNSRLSNKGMYCYNCEESSNESTKTTSVTCSSGFSVETCSKIGNGYARIIFIGKNVPTSSTSYEYLYTGIVQEFVAPYTGKYKIELWGAQGGAELRYNTISHENWVNGGYGGYTKGVIALEKGETLYIYVGEAGSIGTNGNNSESTVGQGARATFNGGGAGGNAGGSASLPYHDYSGGNSGGGATDVRLMSGSWDNVTSLRSRIMVAGGGGGYVDYSEATGPSGDLSSAGGLISEKGCSVVNENGSFLDKAGSLANQTSGNAFGIGGTGSESGYAEYCSGHSGGGGGYYGGGGALNTGYYCYKIGGGGGSSFISGHTGSVAVKSQTDSSAKSGCTTGTSDNTCSIHYSNKVFTDTVMIDGRGYSWTNIKGNLKKMPSPYGYNYDEGTGHLGNGYAKISFVS